MMPSLSAGVIHIHLADAAMRQAIDEAVRLGARIRMPRPRLPMGTVKDDYEPLSPQIDVAVVQRILNQMIQVVTGDFRTFLEAREIFARALASVELVGERFTCQLRRYRHRERAIRAALAYHQRHDQRRRNRKSVSRMHA
jgi:hypothetical protein